MKNIFKISSVALILGLSLGSCSDYLDVNDNPNVPSASTATPELTLPAAQEMTADQLTDNMNQLGNVIIPNWSNNIEQFIFFQNESKYIMSTGFYAEIWEELYWANANYDLVRNVSVSGTHDNYVAIAKIMQSFNFQYIVDLYGDAPYTEAFMRDANLTPAFDSAESIYRNLVTEIDEAIVLINNAPAEAIDPGSTDIMLNGDMNMWIKFANTLKLRILLRESQRTGGSDPAYVATQITAMAGAQFLGAGDNVYANPGYSNSSTAKQNPFFAQFGEDINGGATPSNGATKANDYTMDYLKNTNDDRYTRIYAPIADGTYIGMTQDAIDLDGDNVVPFSGLGDGLLTDSEQSAIIFTAAESLLLQAEAAEFYGLAGSAQTFYEQAIVESYRFLEAGYAHVDYRDGIMDLDAPFGEPDPETTAGELVAYTLELAQNYYNQPGVNNVNWAASGNKLEAIINQKWVALNGINGIESWIEHTRTGYPLNLPIVASASSTTRPIRLLYPGSEIQSNSQNVPSQVVSEAFSSPVFWNN